MIDTLHDLAMCSLYIVFIVIAIGMIAITIAGVYYCIREMLYRVKKCR